MLHHKNIVSYYGSGTTPDGEQFLAMEYVNGPSLNHLLESERSLPYKRTLEILIQTCAAVFVAHEKGIVHRDLKPANIMLSTDAHGVESVKVLDFGVSKLLPFQGETFQTKTQTGEMLGSILYMSPEQCLDQDLDGRSDIYSLGCVLYEVLTGVPPLFARTAFETMNKHMSQKPKSLWLVRPDLDFPEQLESIVQRCLEKRPEDRYSDVAVLEAELLSLLKVSQQSDGIVTGTAQRAQRQTFQRPSLEEAYRTKMEKSAAAEQRDGGTSIFISDLSRERVHDRVIKRKYEITELPKGLRQALKIGGMVLLCCFAMSLVTHGPLLQNSNLPSALPANSSDQLVYVQTILVAVLPIILLWIVFALWRRRRTK